MSRDKALPGLSFSWPMVLAAAPPPAPRRISYLQQVTKSCLRMYEYLPIDGDRDMLVVRLTAQGKVPRNVHKSKITAGAALLWASGRYVGASRDNSFRV